MLELPRRLSTARAAPGESARAQASAPIARFFSASPESLWARIEATQPALVADAQRLFEQIATTRQSALRSASLHHLDTGDAEKKGHHDKVWAVVAVVATAIAHDLKKERQRVTNNNSNSTANGKQRANTTARVVGRKRKIRTRDAVQEEDDDDDDDEKDEDDTSSVETGSDAGNGDGGHALVRPTPQWHLVEFLVEANVPMGVFLENLTSLFDRLLLDPELLEVTTQLKEEFTVATVLFEKYRFVWKKFALHEQSHRAPPERTELLQRIGWLLFLVAHRKFPSVYAGLGSLYYLLLAVLKLMISQVAPRSLEAEVAAALSSLGGPLGKGGPTGTLDEPSLMEMLCATPKVDPDEVHTAYAHVTAFVLTLVRDETLVTKDLKDDDADDTAATLRNVFSPPTLRQNATRLFQHYAQTYMTSSGSFDERVYLNEQSRQSLLGPRPSSVSAGGGGATHETSNGDAAHGGMPPMASRPDRFPPTPTSNPLASPARRPMTPSRRDASSTPSGAAPPPSPFTVQAWQWHGSSPPPALPRGLHTPLSRTLGGGVPPSPFVIQTPVTAAVEISSWIRDTLANASENGGAVGRELQVFFSDCTSDPSDRIADVLSEMSHKLLTNRRRSSATGTGPSSLESGRSEFSQVDGSLQKTTTVAVALFYRVLEALLASERARLRTTNFSSLLNNETFISSLFACSLEVGLKAHSLITLSFPFLLENVGVNAFDFGKVIESFVKHVPRLPGTLKRHMRDLEQMILDSLAWRADSGLYAVLKGEPSQVVAAASTTSPPTSSEASSPTPPVTPTSATSGPRATVLQLFFRKVLSLAATRIFRLGSMLELEAAHMNQVWSAIKECLSSQVHLLKDRHLDQIILCSIYGVCKVNKLSTITFNKIIEQYKKLQTPQWAVLGANGAAQSAAHAAFASASLTRKSSDIIRDIKLSDDKDGERGDVIKFYNRCYIPAMKVFLLQYQAQDRQVAAANAAVASATGSRDAGQLVTSSTSDSEIVAEAAASAVEKVMQTYAPTPPRTPVRARPQPSARSGSATPLFGSPSRNLPMFTTAEVESLPVSVHQTSPKRVLASNIYMSPLQNARYQQQRSHMTPRSHALYAFGESPSRDLALINRAVNSSSAGGGGGGGGGGGRGGGSVRTAAPPPLVVGGGDHSDHQDDNTTSGSNSSHTTTPTNKRRRT